MCWTAGESSNLDSPGSIGSGGRVLSFDREKPCLLAFRCAENSSEDVLLLDDVCSSHNNPSIPLLPPEP